MIRLNDSRLSELDKRILWILIKNKLLSFGDLRGVLHVSQDELRARVERLEKIHYVRLFSNRFGTVYYVELRGGLFG